MHSETCDPVPGPPIEPPRTEMIPDLTAADQGSGEASEQNPGADAWRDEISAKLNRYRARHKVRPPRYPSLTLPFGPADAPPATSPEEFPGSFGPSKQAVAFDGLCQDASALPERDLHVQAALPATPVQLPPPQAGAKIIEFPRSAWAPPPPPLDQLAEPVGEQLRILEVPEVAPPAPALGGITIEPIPSAEPERRPGIDFPLATASLARRSAASVIDGLIIGSACALFGYIFWKITAVRPPRLQLMGLGIGIPLALWAAYQYLLITYSATTPGLLASGLKLARFDGRTTSRSIRRWRVLASYLSAVSLAMGYVWVFLDEDVLCWHDRITHTYLATKSDAPTEPANSGGPA